jgi:hypothetical protein
MPLPQKNKQGFYGFPVRKANLNKIWKKPVNQTKYAYQVSYHIRGSCSRVNTQSMNYIEQKYQSQFPDCPLHHKMHFGGSDIFSDTPLGRMNHYHASFRETRGVVQLKDYPDFDDCTQWFRQTVVMQLEVLHDRVRAE